MYVKVISQAKMSVEFAFSLFNIIVNRTMGLLTVFLHKKRNLITSPWILVNCDDIFQ